MTFLPIFIAFCLLFIVSHSDALSSSPAGSLKKVTIQNATRRLAVANDGSPQIFYFEPGPKPTDRWIVYLQGGVDCYSEKTCETRWLIAKSLMSSTVHPDSINPKSGLASRNPTNPLYGANLIWVPYLSSDAFMGNASAEETGTKWQFRGRPCLVAVLQEVFVNGFEVEGSKYRIPSHSHVLFTGTSAGGIGVLLNANFVGDFIKVHCPTCQYRLLPDSGFFVGSLPDPIRTKADCNISSLTCSFPDSVHLGMRLWKAEQNVDLGCALDMTRKNLPISHCAYGSVAVQYVRFSMFLVQYLFDAVELLLDGYMSKATNTYVEKIAVLKRQVFSLYPSFLPSCWGHVLTGATANFTGLARTINGNVTLSYAISRWYFHNDLTSYRDDCSTLDCRPCPVIPPWEWNLTAMIEQEYY